MKRKLNFWQWLIGVVCVVACLLALYFGATRPQAIGVVFVVAFFGALFTMGEVPNAFVVFFVTGLGTIAAGWWEFVINGGPIGAFVTMLVFFVAVLFFDWPKDWKVLLRLGVQATLTCTVLLYWPSLMALMA